jgi:hypothetical protein
MGFCGKEARGGADKHGFSFIGQQLEVSDTKTHNRKKKTLE